VLTHPNLADFQSVNSSKALTNFEIIDDSDVAFTRTKNVFPNHICLGSIHHALNEVLIHRENGASLMQADLSMNGSYCTTIQADGMIFSTPTGSTAYNISAGGSLISPTVPCIALTPICPHTLSFRPVVVPDTTIIHLQIPLNARSAALLSCDGQNPVTLQKGDVVEIIKCPYPVPTFKSDQFNVEWFRGLVDKFNWNVREIQKSIPNINDKNDGSHNGSN
jgi:NAD+ kinase